MITQIQSRENIHLWVNLPGELNITHAANEEGITFVSPDDIPISIYYIGSNLIIKLATNQPANYNSSGKYLLVLPLAISGITNQSGGTVYFSKSFTANNGCSFAVNSFNYSKTIITVQNISLLTCKAANFGTIYLSGSTEIFYAKILTGGNINAIDLECAKFDIDNSCIDGQVILPSLFA